MNLACESFLSLCRLLDQFLFLKEGKITRSVILPLLQAHLAAHRQAYGDEYIKPKHHFGFHNVLAGDNDKVWLDCFVHERKHQIVKDSAEPVKNTSAFEASVLGRVLLQQLRQVQHTALADCLLGEAKLHPGLSQELGGPVRVAKCVQFQGATIGLSDVLLVEGQVAIVRACAQLDSRFFVLLQLCQPHGFRTFGATTFRFADDGLYCLFLDTIDASWSKACAWSWSEDASSLLVLHRDGAL